MNIDKVSKVLLGGGVAILPTDTVYGLCCCALDPEAVGRLYGIKHRSDKPGTIIASSIDQLVDLGFKRRYLKAVEQFWPGAVSVVIPIGRELEYLGLGKGSIAVRVTSDQKLINLLSKTGALLTSSANMPGQPVVKTIDEAKSVFGDKIDVYLAGGDLSNRQPSSVIRVIDDAIEVLRQGAVKISEKGEVKN